MDARNDDLAEGADNWLADVRKALLARWWLVLGVALLALIGAVLYLRSATYFYSAELRVYAAPSSSSAPQVPGQLGTLASLAGLGSSGGDSATPFRLFLEGMKSREVAERLSRQRGLMRDVFAGEWDARTNSWREHRGVVGSLKRSVWDVLGLRSATWQAPDAARLQDFITENVHVAQSLKSPLVSITLEHPDPKFAVRFLTVIAATTDQYLREKQQERLRGNIAYLSEKLRGITFAEQRQVLFAALSDQERQSMLANAAAPYAANPFGVATASRNPTTPRQLPLLLAGLIGGLILGVVTALLLGRRKPRAVAMIESA